MFQVFQKYNGGMGGVDLSDQLISSYDVLIKSVRWWKTLFFHSVDIAATNAYILFRQWQILNDDIPQLKRGKSTFVLRIISECIFSC